MCRLIRALSEGNFSFNLNGNPFVDPFAFLCLLILVSSEGNILAIILINVSAIVIGWLPFFVLAVIKIFLFGIIKANPFVFASFLISRFTFGFVILDRYLFAFVLIPFFIAWLVDLFPNDFAFLVSS